MIVSLDKQTSLNDIQVSVMALMGNGTNSPTNNFKDTIFGVTYGNRSAATPFRPVKDSTAYFKPTTKWLLIVSQIRK